ncbi:MAG: pyridoxamine 5'-phosphate oxidase family protein [Candidatus Eremiobacteraeota bacterium]|nr:pyridoxamine 5'-phosphate oxidase family protein [Candidatus Eremiobacteraeota bacterium]
MLSEGHANSIVRTRLRRHPERALTEREQVLAIVDEGLVAHVGFIDSGAPVVIPTTYARVGNTLYLHGAASGRLMSVTGASDHICVTITLLDGIVLARSAFNHSMNYRSVVIFGRPRPVTDEDEKRGAFAALVEHVIPGRGADTREASETELKTTGIVAIDLNESSAKRRSGPPKDGKADESLPHWAGVVPAQLVFSQPEPDERACNTSLPDYLQNYNRSPKKAQEEG